MIDCPSKFCGMRQNGRNFFFFLFFGFRYFNLFFLSDVIIGNYVNKLKYNFISRVKEIYLNWKNSKVSRIISNHLTISSISLLQISF